MNSDRATISIPVISPHAGFICLTGEQYSVFLDKGMLVFGCAARKDEHGMLISHTVVFQRIWCGDKMAAKVTGGNPRHAEIFIPENQKTGQT